MWIKISDRLPNSTGRYYPAIVTEGHLDLVMSRLNRVDPQWYSVREDAYVDVDYVIAWYDLPDYIEGDN